MPMDEIACDITPKFKVALDTIKPDLVLIRADRAELLPCAMLSVYGGYKVAQLEAGDLSGTWDNKIRYSISHLSDFHFTTNDEAYRRLLTMGFTKVYNEGSLDCEYAMDVQPQNLHSKPYILVLWHPTPDEDSNELYEAINGLKNDFEIVGIRGNHDYGEKSSYKEFYKPDEFINLLRYAKCLVGNSSAGLKEASVLGTPVVNVGSRQKNRLRPDNVKDCKCEKKDIEYTIKYQLEHRYPISTLYYKPYASKKIAEVIKNVL